MDILGIGPLELLLIAIIMLVVLGPRDLVKTARAAGRFIRTIIRSPLWSTVMNTSREIREIPTRLVRESGLEEDIKTIRQQTNLQEVAGEVMSEMHIGEAEISLTEDPVEHIHTETGPVTDLGPIQPPSEDPPQEDQAQAE